MSFQPVRPGPAIAIHIRRRGMDFEIVRYERIALGPIPPKLVLRDLPAGQTAFGFRYELWADGSDEPIYAATGMDPTGASRESVSSRGSVREASGEPREFRLIAPEEAVRSATRLVIYSPDTALRNQLSPERPVELRIHY